MITASGRERRFSGAAAALPAAKSSGAVASTPGIRIAPNRWSAIAVSSSDRIGLQGLAPMRQSIPQKAIEDIGQCLDIHPLDDLEGEALGAMLPGGSDACWRPGEA